MDQARDLLATTSSVLVLLGLAVRFILYPWLRDQLLAPQKEIHRQVTENNHSNPSPTLPDRIEDLASDVRTLTWVVDRHLRDSEEWTTQHERRIDVLEERGKHE